MLQIAICEDSRADLDLLSREINAVTEKLHLRTDMDCFKNGEALITAIKNGSSYDLLLLDIYLDSMNGLETAQAARALLPKVQTAFLTAYKEFALDAFGLDAVHYLLKPVSGQDIDELFRRFFERTHRPPEVLEIDTGKKTYVFPLARVQKIQSNNKGVDIYLQDIPPPQRIPISFIRVEEQLDPKRFLRISRGLLVHNSYIQRIVKNVCYFRDGTSALISRREKNTVRKKYNDYLFSNSHKGVSL